MAIHYLSETLGFDGEGQPIISGPYHMPTGRYFGFAIGPAADHDAVLVTANASILVPVGAVIPIEPWDGAPQIHPVRLLHTGSTINGSSDPEIAPATPARIHVIGLTHACELAIPAPRRARARWRFTRGAPGNENVLRFPICGRRHAAVRVSLGVAGPIVISGLGDGESPFELELVNEANSTGDIWHIGGTDHEEHIDVLKVAVDSDGAVAIDVFAAGELGG